MWVVTKHTRNKTHTHPRRPPLALALARTLLQTNWTHAPLCQSHRALAGAPGLSNRVLNSEEKENPRKLVNG